MKNVVILLICISFSGLSAQKKAGPVIKDFGHVFEIEKPELLLKNDKIYKVIFDVYTNTDKEGDMNPLLNTVARYLNMHAQNGVPAENMKVAVVMHGLAAKDALSNEAYKEIYKIDNPNAKLITALRKANVELYVCGQSYKSRGLPIEGLSKDVKLSLSALTALIEYQEKGYKIINFN
ncbi:MAG: DsrE family protein [Flavobacteriaceae bacterium]|nr:DsrE family protein [Flavobacteriaceae bacterium]